MHLQTPPPAPRVQAPSSLIQDPRRRPTGVVMTEGDISSRRSWFEGMAAFLVSSVLHLMVLVILALIVRQQLSPSVVELRLNSSSSGEPIAIEMINLSEIDSSPAVEPADSLVALQSQILQTLEVERPVTSTRPIAAANRIEHDPNQPPPGDQRKPDVTFFGTHAYGTKFVYVLDISGSMLANNSARIRRARAELTRSINQLGPDHSFYVVLYCNYAIKMFGGSGQPRLIPANEENKKRVAQWVSVFNPRGGTEPGHALRIAGELNPDAIFFLSDGEFVFKPPSDAGIDQFIQGFGQARPSRFRPDILVNSPYPKQVLENYPPEIVVHTVALESKTSRHLMATIAQSTGGQYRFIPAFDRSQLKRRTKP
jgi:hypothetical protein